MSKTVSNVEIEDVLSSIRRLVSEEARPRTAPARPVSERLVLSPALRVHDPETEPVQPEPADQVDDTARASASPIMLTHPVMDQPCDQAQGQKWALSKALLDTASQLEDPEEPDLNGNAAQGPTAIPEAETVTSKEDEDESTVASSSDMLESQSEQDAVADLVNETVNPPEDPLIEDIAEAEQIAALRASLSDILAHGDSSDASENEYDLSDPDVDRHPDLRYILKPQADVEPITSDDTKGADRDGDSALDHKIAALEDVLGGQSKDDHQTTEDNPEHAAQVAPSIQSADEWIEDTRDFDAFVEDAPHSTESGLANRQSQDPGSEKVLNGDAQDREASVEAPEAGPLPGPTFYRHSDDGLLEWEDDPCESDAAQLPEQASEKPCSAIADLDEEALQTLVAEIIRQELQGALGERITRNVRKLVRREIHRVLMSNEFD